MFSPRKGQGLLILTLEVQSSLVRSSLVWFKAEAKPEVLFVDSRDIPYRPGTTTGRFVEMTMEALGATIVAASKRAYDLRAERAADHIPSRIGEVHYVLSSPWISCQARMLSSSFDRDTRVTQAKVDSILESERSRLAPSSAGPAEIIEEKIFDVRLNGYSIANWHNKECRQLGISYALGAVGATALADLEQACGAVATGHQVHFHSSLMLQYIALGQLMPDRQSYTLVHIHGELTDVVGVDRGSCFFFGSYPLGIGSIIRAIAAAGKTDAEAAESFLTLYFEGGFEVGDATRSAELIRKATDEWTSGFSMLIRQSGAEDRLPPATIVAARSHDKFFTEALKASYPQSQTEVLFLDAVAPLVDYSNGDRRQRLVGLYALAVHSLQNLPHVRSVR